MPINRADYNLVGGEGRVLVQELLAEPTPSARSVRKGTKQIQKEQLLFCFLPCVVPDIAVQYMHHGSCCFHSAQHLTADGWTSAGLSK